MDKIKYFLNKVREMSDFDSVKFIILFGSYAYGRPNKLSDYDFAVYYVGDKKERFKFRLKILSKLSDDFDVQIFQDLPLYVQKEVLKGKVIYVKDEDLGFVYDTAYSVIKRFEDFKKAYYDYIGMERIK
ncbi:MAG: nucleotidyltransferase domain-containing protein [Nanoarchaeota archaeon]